MNLIDLAKRDWQDITTNEDSGFGKPITISTPDGSVSAIVTGLATNHHIGVDTDGNLHNVKNSHISFSEEQLTVASYPVRNSNQFVDLINHQVTFKDSTGLDKNYIISETFPDETIGVILCILVDRE